MLSLGQKVRIARINTNDCGPRPVVKKVDDYEYEEVEGTYVGQVGEVIKRDCGTAFPSVCGESPTDPFYTVKTPIGTDGFWTEELEVVP